MTEQLPAVRARVTPEIRALYLQTMAATGDHPESCRVCGVSRRTMAAHIAAHPEFAEEVEDAKAQYASVLLAEAHRRAVTGLAGELVLHEGKPVRDPANPNQWLRKPTRYSERLLLALISKLGPSQFVAPDRVVHEHQHSGVIEHRESDVIPPAIYAAMSVPARLDYRRALILLDCKRGVYPAGDGDTALMTAIAELTVEAQRAGVTFGAVEFFKECRPHPDVIEATYEEVELSTAEILASIPV